MEVLSGTHMELIDEEIHTALIDDIFGPDDNDDDVSKVGSPDSKPSIDFSVVTPDSQGKNTFPNESYNLPELDDAHDSFDFDDSLDLFSNQGADNDNNSVSDMSDQKAKPKKRTMKEKKEKKIRAKPAAPSFKEEEEARKAQVVESEIEVGALPQLHCHKLSIDLHLALFLLLSGGEESGKWPFRGRAAKKKPDRNVWSFVSPSTRLSIFIQ